MSETAELIGRERHHTALLALVALVIGALLGGGGALLLSENDSVTRTDATTGEVPDRYRSGPGTPLRHGLTVAEGSVLVGPVRDLLPAPYGERLPLESLWSTTIQVTGQVGRVWADNVRQLSGLAQGQPPPTPNVCTASYPCLFDIGFEEGGRQLGVTARLESFPGNVVDGYLIRLSGAAPFAGTGSMSFPAGTPIPEPFPAVPRPEVGEALAPMRAFEPGDEERIVREPGSELVINTSDQFPSLLLAIEPGADRDAVVASYLEQTVLLTGDREAEVTRGQVGEVSITMYRPDPAAGGYSAALTLLDRPGDDQDYLVYDLGYD